MRKNRALGIAAIWLALIALVCIYTDRDAYTWRYAQEELPLIMQSQEQAAAAQQASDAAYAKEAEQAAQRQALGQWVIGAAAASAAAFAVGGVLITVKLWKHPKVSPKGQSLAPDMAILRPCLRVALPNMLQRFGTSLGYVAFASMINSLGEVATAAHTISVTP